MSEMATLLFAASISAPLGASVARLALRRCACGYYHWRWSK